MQSAIDSPLYLAKITKKDGIRSDNSLDLHKEK